MKTIVSKAVKAVILAAGRGTRLRADSNNLPKCLLEIGTRKLLDHQLTSLSSMGIKDVIMVLGFKREKIKEHLASYSDMHFTLLENSRYSSTNTAYSLWHARNEMTDDFIYMNGDVLFHPEILRRLIHSHKDNALAVVRKQTGEEEVKVILDVSRVKSIGKDIPAVDAYGEFIGLAKFSGKTAPLFKSVLEDIIETEGGKQEYFEAALQRMLSSVYISAIDVTDLPCVEIDFPEDLIEAKTNIIYELTEKENIKTPRVLFYVERNLHLPFLEPIHDYMAANYSVELAFSAPPFRPPQHGLAGRGLEKDSIKRLKGKSKFYENPEEFHADVAVVADACLYPVRHCGRVVNVGHGLISKGWFYTDSPAVRRENLADLICVPGQWHKEILQKNVFSPINLTGFIKSDALFDCSQYDKEVFCRKYNITGNKKIVLFAPTFNEELSSIPCIQERIVELTDEGTILLIKLHSMTAQKWVNMYSELGRTEKNVRFIEDRDFSQAMACADVMVSDVSSAYVEFMLLDKPVVLFNNPMQKNYSQYDSNDIEYRVRDAGIQVGSVEEMKLAVKLSLANPSEFSSRRKTYANTLNYRIDGKCAQRAARAIMQLINDCERQVTDNVLFSIMVQWDHAPSEEEIYSSISEIKEKSKGLLYEIFFVGQKPSNGLTLPEINAWVDDQKFTGTSLNLAVEMAAGSFIVFLKPNTVLPKSCLKWMYHYFKWHADAGAVKAISSRENYKEILSEVPESQRPKSFPDITDYFLHFLMGNDVPADCIEKDNECLMISKKIYEQVGGLTAGPLIPDPIQEFGMKLKDSGYSLRNAVEVFVYPLEQKSQGVNILSLVPLAQKYKKEKNYKEAISLLEKAKSLLDTSQEEDRQGKTKQVLSLLDESRAYKKKKEYKKSIELLEEAKGEINYGICWR